MGDFTSEVISQIDRRFVEDLLAKGERVDGRAFDAYRDIEIELDVVAAKAEGSAIVRMGNTTVVAGVKVLSGTPYPDSPDQGVVMVTAEMSPLASPFFELGPPREDAIELARVVDRGVRESETVDVSKLCIEPGKLVYTIFCDIYPLEYDGNLIDASSLAANAALKRTRFPELKWEDAQAVPTGKEMEIPIQNLAIECTVSMIGKHMIIDPTLHEEMVQDARLTLAVDEKNNFTALQKGGGIGPMSIEQIDTAMGMALERSKDLRGLIDEAIKASE
ncbi:MAG: exosome complex protein Rrp42 [Candidatus Thorarchaeota archaeon]